MGSIAGILAQGPKPITIPNPFGMQEDYNRAQAQKQLLTNEQQENQVNALKIQEAQQQQQSQQAISRAYLQANGNISAAIPLAATGGARPSDILALQAKDTEQKKALADLDTTQLGNHDKHVKVALETLGPLSQLPPDQAAQQYPQVIGSLIQTHDLDANDLKKAGLDPGAYPGPEVLQHWVAGLNGYQQNVTNEQKDREVKAQEIKAQSEAATSAATVAEKGTETEQKQRALDAAALATAAKQGPDALQGALDALPHGRARLFQGVTDPAQITRLGMTPEEQVKTDQTAAERSETLRHNRVDESNAAGRLNVERGRLSMEQQAAGFGPPGVVSPAAQMAADGRMDPATIRAMLRKNPGLIGQIQKIDPKWDEGDIDKRFNTIRDFTNTSNTKAGGQSIALNTMIHHADLYLDTAEALKNGNFKPGNAAYNTVSSMLGSPAPNNAALVSRFLAGETGKVATGGVPAEGEVNGILASLGTNGSPDQMKQAGEKLLQIAAGKLIPLQETVKDAKAENVIHVLKPDAQAILQKRGYDPNTLKPMAQAGGSIAVKAPNGKTYTFKSQADADTFKKNAGIQ